MVRRAFRTAFSDTELEDIYSSAWVGTLRTLERRHAELSDEEIRKYLLTAVANQASKELRRRRRKPTAPLEFEDAVVDDAGGPDERAVGSERTRIARDLLASLPKRRRAVMLLRYGWGLDPQQVCELVDGLSPRAYRKEVTRGVDELTDRMRRLERGDWCADRESVLKAYAAGVADVDESRQARAHLSHCHGCSEFVARLGGHLHDLGAAAAVPASLDALDGRASIVDRIGEACERVRDAVGGIVTRGGGEGAGEIAGQIGAAGGTRGAAGGVGAALVAKLAGLGTAGKVAAVCLTGGAAATACLSAAIVPGLGPAGVGADREQSSPRQPAAARTAAPEEIELNEPEVGRPAPPPVRQTRSRDAGDAAGEAKPEPPPVEQTEPVAEDTPPVQQEFGIAATAAPAGGGDSSGSSAGGGGTGSGGSAVKREFGP